MSSGSRMVFEADCRACEHTVKTTLKPNNRLIKLGFARIRCKECETTNAIEQSEIQ